jgi:MoaA/NifB/PqqE/SkfB family radical SAM enzyme
VLDFITPVLPKVAEIGLHGYGEPLIAKGLVEACETYSSYDVKLQSFTNMHHLSADLLKIIKKSFIRLNVSCEGATIKIFEGIRKRGDFRKFCRNVTRVRYGCEDLVMIMAVALMRQNIKQAPALVNLAKVLGFNEIAFWTLHVWPDVSHLATDSPRLYPRTANYYLETATEVAKEVGIKISVPQAYQVPPDAKSMDEELKAMKALPLFPGPEVEKELQKKFGKRQGARRQTARIAPRSKKRGVGFDELDKSNAKCTEICPWPLRKMQIKVNGDVSVCCHNGKLIAGNIYETEDFSAIWNGPFYKKIRQTFFDGYLPKACSDCEFIHRQQGLNLIEPLTINQDI